MLSLLHHSNLVRLIGYCTDGDQRLLVYEYMPMGCLEDHLFGNYLLFMFLALTLNLQVLDCCNAVEALIGLFQTTLWFYSH